MSYEVNIPARLTSLLVLHMRKCHFVGWFVAVLPMAISLLAQEPLRFTTDEAHHRPILTPGSHAPLDSVMAGDAYFLQSAGEQTPPTSSLGPDDSTDSWKKLMRPSFDFAAEWQAKTDDVRLVSYDANVKFPTYPVFGPPPPFINAGFRSTIVDGAKMLGLPADLHETELGLSWVRPMNERWTTLFMLGTSFATDGKNTSSDAWRFRGGAFAIYRRSAEWTWTFGAIALGRNDIPVVPAVGATYQPSPELRFELTFPKPRISFLLADNGPRQQWGYFGAGLDGSTWGIQRTDGIDDQLTYGDFRAVLGWESTPTREPSVPFTRGRKLGAEIGYVFSRDFEFEDNGTKIRLGDTLMLRASASF